MKTRAITPFQYRQDNPEFNIKHHKHNNKNKPLKHENKNYNIYIISPLRQVRLQHQTPSSTVTQTKNNRPTKTRTTTPFPATPLRQPILQHHTSTSTTLTQDKTAGHQHNNNSLSNNDSKTTQSLASININTPSRTTATQPPTTGRTSKQHQQHPPLQRTQQLLRDSNQPPTDRQRTYL